MWILETIINFNRMNYETRMEKKRETILFTKE